MGFCTTPDGMELSLLGFMIEFAGGIGPAPGSFARSFHLGPHYPNPLAIPSPTNLEQLEVVELGFNHLLKPTQPLEQYVYPWY